MERAVTSEFGRTFQAVKYNGQKNQEKLYPDLI